MKNRVSRLLGLTVLALGAWTAVMASASAQQYGSAKLTWKALPLINMTITANYQAGFGPQGGAGSGATPAPGPAAVLNGNTVDFGSNVVQGFQYLYKFAALASVTTNDLSGFTIYAEGTSNINDLTSGGTVPLNQVLYWVKSSSANTPFSAATAFQDTTSPVGCGGTCINYAGTPPVNAQVFSFPTQTFGQPGNAVSQGFDYQLRLGSISNPDQFQVFLVYTAVAN
jgi:hypothetical protein